MKQKRREAVLKSRLVGYANAIGFSARTDDKLKSLPKRCGGFTRPGSNKKR